MHPSSPSPSPATAIPRPRTLRHTPLPRTHTGWGGARHCNTVVPAVVVGAGAAGAGAGRVWGQCHPFPTGGRKKEAKGGASAGGEPACVAVNGVAGVCNRGATTCRHMGSSGCEWAAAARVHSSRHPPGVVDVDWPPAAAGQQLVCAVLLLLSARRFFPSRGRRCRRCCESAMPGPHTPRPTHALLHTARTPRARTAHCHHLPPPLAVHLRHSCSATLFA